MSENYRHLTILFLVGAIRANGQRELMAASDEYGHMTLTIENVTWIIYDIVSQCVTYCINIVVPLRHPFTLHQISGCL